MTSYTITSRTSGLYLGAYAAQTADEAVEAMHREAGYRSSQEAAQALGETVESLRADLIVEPADEADETDEAAS